MRSFAVIAVLTAALPAVADLSSSKANDDNAFLRPYLDELKKATPPRQLERIRALPRDGLVMVHLSYGQWIRNKWLWGNRNPKLIEFFRAKGLTHPDDMSSALVAALWEDLDRNLSPERRPEIERKRDLFARKMALYKTLGGECSDQITAHKADLEKCYPPGPAPDLSFSFVVSNKGQIESVTFLPASAHNCVRTVLSGFTV